MSAQGSALSSLRCWRSDFLQVSSTKSSLGVATAQSRALTWASRYAGLPVLKDALTSPIIKSYTVPSELALERSCPTPVKLRGLP